MPGVLLIEGMAQTAGAVVLEHLGDEHAGKLVFFMSIDNARFRKPVVPGDTVRFQCDGSRTSARRFGNTRQKRWSTASLSPKLKSARC